MTSSIIEKYEGRKVFFTSDTHFFHGNIIKYCSRPWSSAEEMNEGIILNWNSVVGPDDIVFHLGDFSAGNQQCWEGILDRLNGEIHLIMGNHDPRSMENEALASRFAEVTFQKVIEVDGQTIILNHYPLLTFAGRDGSTWQLFGHLHTNPTGEGMVDPDRHAFIMPSQYEVGMDSNGYKPLSFAKVKAIMEERLAVKEDNK